LKSFFLKNKEVTNELVKNHLFKINDFLDGKQTQIVLDSFKIYGKQTQNRF